MITKQELEAQLAAIPRFQPTSVKKELATLHEKIQPGETIAAAVSGTIDGSTWLGIATDRRVLFGLIKLIGGESTWEVPYENLTTVKSKAGMLLSELVLGSSTGTKKITNIPKADCKHFADAVTRMRTHRAPHPTVHGAAAVVSPPTSSPSRSAAGSKLGLIVSAVCVIAVCNAIFRDKSDKSSLQESAPKPQAPSDTSNPPETSAPAISSDPCERARPELRRSCPRIDISGRCQVAVKSQTTLEIDKLGPGQLIGVGGPGPEWFIKTDGTLITVNGLAAGACDGLPDVPGYLGARIVADAPRRGDNAKTYEGTYNKDGGYVHQDCSAFEIRVARILYRELMQDEPVDEKVALRRAAQQAELKPKVLDQIYQKVVMQCMLALTSG